MPIYEFRCGGCGAMDEIIEPFEDSEQTHLCQCGGTLKRIPSVPGMVTIHDCVGKGDLYHRRTYVKGGEATNTTDGFGSRYYFKNNPSEDPKVINRKLKSNAKSTRSK